MAELRIQFQFRNDTAANWTSVNPVLELAEPGFENDTGQWKTGDGVTAWNSLAYQLGGMGPPGADGADGVDGLPGADGADGLPGADGAQGIQGDDGVQGPQGPQGIPGNDGLDGIQGLQGIDGPAGSDGPQGLPGSDGADGSTGLPGADGSDGAQGLPGNDGADGATGPPGTDGSNGAQGIQGIPGNDGSDGGQGIQGIQGPPGADGIDGAVGPEGPEGPQGPAGGSSTATEIFRSLAVNGTDIHEAAGTSVDIPWVNAADGVWMSVAGSTFTALQDIPLLEIITAIVITNSAVNNRSRYRIDINHRTAGDVDIWNYAGMDMYIRDDTALYDSGSVQFTLPLRTMLAGDKLTIRMYVQDTQTAASSVCPVDGTESYLIMTVVD